MTLPCGADVPVAELGELVRVTQSWLCQVQRHAPGNGRGRIPKINIVRSVSNVQWLNK